MNNNANIPTWISDGPPDIEYCTYKLKGTILDIKKKLASGNLLGALLDVDNNLDYLYMYDAIKVTHNPNPINHNMTGFDLPGLELFFTEDEIIETDPVLDFILDDALDSFEELHSMCRERWRLIEDGIKCNYVPTKPYFLNDGFVFVKTPDNKMHVYHFVKPNKYFTSDWRKFSMTHMYDEQWTNEAYFSRIEEIVSKEDNKIIIRIDCKNETILKDNALGVINQMIFSMLHRDYSF